MTMTSSGFAPRTCPCTSSTQVVGITLCFRMTPLQLEILALKKKKNAVILAHNYQVREIQEVADYVGDSLGLAYQAQASQAEIILFCGVHFMAETAKIVNPTKKVLLPDMDAGCSLAESCDAAELAAYKERHPGVYVVAYIN